MSLFEVQPEKVLQPGIVKSLNDLKPYDLESNLEYKKIRNLKKRKEKKCKSL